MMSGRPSVRVDHGYDVPPGTGRRASNSAGGRHASPARQSSSYVTASRLAAIRAALAATDWPLVETVQQFGFVSTPQLARIHFGDDDAASRAGRRAVSRLSELGVLSALERRIGGVRRGSDGMVWRLGVAGTRLLDCAHRTLGEPGLHHLQHSLAIVDLYARLKSAERRGEANVLRFEAEPLCWREYLGPHGEPVVLKPDGYVDLRLDGGRRLWFVEVDRGTVSTATLRKKLRRYGEYFETGQEQQRGPGVFPRVVWATDIARRTAHLACLCREENERLGMELHRLLGDEWVPP
jgi:hypothetical protein